MSDIGKRATAASSNLKIWTEAPLLKLDRRFVMHEQPAPIVQAPGHPVLNRKPATLIIFQDLKHTFKFRAVSKLITSLVGEKHR